MTKVSIAFFMVLAALSSTASAQDIYERCSAARSAGDLETVVQLAETLERFTVHPAARERTAELCVTAAKGYRVHLDLASGKFLNDAEYEELLKNREHEETVARATVRARDDLEASIRSQKEASRMEVMQKTVDACRELYSRDWVVAMTSDLCQPIFMETGLPD